MAYLMLYNGEETSRAKKDDINNDLEGSDAPKFLRFSCSTNMPAPSHIYPELFD